MQEIPYRSRVNYGRQQSDTHHKKVVWITAIIPYGCISNQLLCKCCPIRTLEIQIHSHQFASSVSKGLKEILFPETDIRHAKMNKEHSLNQAIHKHLAACFSPYKIFLSLVGTNLWFPSALACLLASICKAISKEGRMHKQINRLLFQTSICLILVIALKGKSLLWNFVSLKAKNISQSCWASHNVQIRKKC